MLNNLEIFSPADNCYVNLDRDKAKDGIPAIVS